MGNIPIVLKNETLTIEIATQGAELKSIIENDGGNQYLWHGDPSHWGRSAPILFPIVGKLKDDKYRVNNGFYHLSQHGFARDSLFENPTATDEEATFELTENSETKKVFPYDFCLRVNYRLLGNKVEITYEVMNRNKGPMLFSIGSHPAFRVPFSNGSLGDYFVEFEKREKVGSYHLVNGLQSNEQPSVLADGRKLQLHTNLFNRDALLFKGLESRNISIKNKLDEKKITINTGGAPFLGIWSKSPMAPFLCIEPWYGIADSTNSDYDFTKKEGVNSLETNQIFIAHYSITIK